jgi:Aminoglycoside-2''-adenylyltransferase
VEPDARQLSSIAAIGQLLESAGYDYWLFGGWAVDFHLRCVTRPHGDVDLAVWSRDAEAIGRLLVGHGWEHAPDADEDGGTGYQRDGIRVELTFIVAGNDGEVLIAFSGGTATWSHRRFGAEVRTLGGVTARVIPLDVLRDGKSRPRADPGHAERDRADYDALLSLPPDRVVG